MSQTLDLANLTMSPPPVFPELYESLWWYSGSYNSSGGNTYGGGTGANGFVTKGSTSNTANTTTASRIELYTLNSNWPANLQYSFEATIWLSTGTATVYATLWDLAMNTQVSGSEISTTATTATPLRSGKFTLTPGHTYGIATRTMTGSVYLTDASLIIFPSSPLTSPSVSAISLANPSGNTLKEAYMGMWIYSSGVSSVGSGWLQKGTTSLTATGTSSSANKLLTLSNTWAKTQKFAFEASIYTTSGNTANAYFEDITTGNQITSVSTTSTTATVVRSGSFNSVNGFMNPGDSFGVYLGANTYLTKAHLIALAN